jgi:hypothetical protein
VSSRTVTSTRAAAAAAAVPDLWTLVLAHPHIDPDQLAAALERQTLNPPLDFRTRLLVRDSLDALRKVWGLPRTNEWIMRSRACDVFNAIQQEELAPDGFPFLVKQLMESIKPDVILALLRELGDAVDTLTSITIGGAAALIIANRLARMTQDVYVVDELPAPIRDQHDLLAKLADRYRLRLTHFQSHYLPSGWVGRRKSLARFGNLHVFLVDELDIAIGKLFSNREKDRDDLRVLAGQIEKQAFVDRLRLAGQAHLKEPALRQNAEKNWYVLFGDALPA